MWSGTVSTIPSGWYLCDGNNSTPDLRNKFVIGAHSDSGGEAKTTVLGTASISGGSKDAYLVSHTHGAGTYSAQSAGAHTHTYDHNQSQTSLDNDEGNATIYPNQTSDTTGSAGAHTHSYNRYSGTARVDNDENVQRLNGTTSATTGSSGAHTHTVSGNSSSAGSSATNANLPPYYALCYIMKS